MSEKTFKIVTLGCKVNQYESASIEASLIAAGWTKAGKGEPAQAVIVNTCLITRRAAYQSRQAIRKAIRENPHGKAAAIGCYAQVSPGELETIRGLRLIVGNTAKDRFPELLVEPVDSGSIRVVSEPFDRVPVYRHLPAATVSGLTSERTRAFLKVQDGCQSFCSYCIVPYARGPLRSLAASDVLMALEDMAARGVKEVVLTGIHLGKYGIDLSPPKDLKTLLKMIGREGLPMRIRLSSLEPNEIDRGLVDTVASEPWLCRHFHIPLQSGDDAILGAMNRPYRARDFRKRIAYIHERMPPAAIGVDTMVGFPGEDEVAFLNTFTLIEDLPVSYLHVFPYSPRPGTRAARLPGRVHSRTIKDRAARMRLLGQKKRQAFYQKAVGRVFEIITEGWESESEQLVRGLSDNYVPVLFHTDRESKNERVSVRVEGVNNNRVLGMVQPSPASTGYDIRSNH